MTKKPISKTRKIYIVRFVGRIIVLICAFLLYFLHPKSFEVLERGKFFSEFSPLHLLWMVWMIDMICQIIPVGRKISIGSLKLFRNRFRPITEKINKEALKKYIISTTKNAYKVMVLWILLLAGIGTFYYLGIFDNRMLFLISVLFYVGDLVCVLIWCPFRIVAKSRCCTTCRIFNWDHFFMFSPMMFVWNFYSMSLFAMSLVVFAIWELSVLIFPERFWEKTNVSLKCSECTDKLCTQYCQKLR